MSVEVILESVGGLGGTRTFKFVKGAINVVKASNAAGKTSLIKAMALCLSVPYRSKSSIELAREMGLLRQPSEAIEPLVHVGSDAAKVTIKLDGEEWRYSLLRNGQYTYTKEGDERFLITSVLTRDSKVLRKLASGDTDFGPIAEMVSLASTYEIIATILEGERARIGDLLEQVERRKGEIKSLMEEEETLREVINKCRHEENRLNRELSELLTKYPEMRRLREQRDELLGKIRSQEAEIEEVKRRVEELKRQIDEETEKHEAKLARKRILEKESEEILKEFGYIEETLRVVSKRLENHEERLKRISEQIEALRIKEGRLLAEIETYERALKFVAQAQKVLCYLCEQGYLTAEALEQRMLLAEKRLSEVRDEISNLLSERNSIYSALREREEYETRLEELRRRRDEIAGELQGLEEALMSYTAEVDRLRGDLAIFEIELRKAKQNRARYEAELATVEGSVRNLGGKEQRIVSKLAEIRGRLNELERQLNKTIKSLELRSRVEIDGHRLSLERAEEILIAWVATINETLKRVCAEARRERVMAVELFNNWIKRVLRECEFEYLDVWVDTNNYGLHIIDRRTSSEITPRILSETERYMLAFVIHTALRLAYTPHVPFFLIDEVILSFDEVRRRAILKYLSELAKENGWVIVITELGRGPEITTSIFTTL